MSEAGVGCWSCARVVMLDAIQCVYELRCSLEINDSLDHDTVVVV